MLPLILAKKTFVIEYEYTHQNYWVSSVPISKREQELMYKAIAYLKMGGELPLIPGVYAVKVTTDLLGSIDSCEAFPIR